MKRGGLTRWRFAPREVPPSGFHRDLASRYPCVLRVEMDVAAERVAARLPAAYRAHLEPTATGCRFMVGAPTWDDLAWHLSWVGRDLQAPLILADDADAGPFRRAMARIAEQAGGAARTRGDGGRPARDG